MIIVLLEIITIYAQPLLKNLLIIILIIFIIVELCVGPCQPYPFLDSIHCWQDSLEGGSAHRKTSTYIQDNRNRIYTQTSMSRMGFKLRIRVYERAKTVHAL
jgi:hypothetical protein